MNAQRNSIGEVTINNGSNTLSCKIPSDRSMLGIVGTNGIIDNGDYRPDGWVYVNNKKHRKWHIQFDGIRLWEPKLDNLTSLYDQWKRTKSVSSDRWNKTWKIVTELWGDGKHKEVIAHALAYHKFEWSGRHEPWWAYKIKKYDNEVSFGFDWLDKKPEKLKNYKLGQALYDAEQRSDTLFRRSYKVERIFFHAMMRSLPKTTENKIISLQFKDDYFYFESIPIRHGKSSYWEMMDVHIKIENIKVV